MNAIYTQAPEVKEIARKAFPGYSGNKYKVAPFHGPKRLDSYWSGGSRNYYSVVSIFGDGGMAIMENGTPFANGGQIERITELPASLALVEHTIFCGTDLGITVYVNTENLTAMLPAPVELSRNERIVLSATRSLKSSYGGVKNYRFHEASRDTKITLPDWDLAKAALIQRGMLNAAGAITDTGRNAIGNTNLYELKGV